MGNSVKEITPEIIKQAEKLAARGLTMEQIAHSVGMGTSTLYDKAVKNLELAEAIKKGRARGIATVANSLYEAAKNGNTTAQIFYLKCRAQWREEDPSEKQDDGIEKAKAAVLELMSKDNNGQPSSTES